MSPAIDRKLVVKVRVVEGVDADLAALAQHPTELRSGGADPPGTRADVVLIGTL